MLILDRERRKRRGKGQANAQVGFEAAKDNSDWLLLSMIEKLSVNEMLTVCEMNLNRRAQAAIYDGKETCTKLQSDFCSAGFHSHWPCALLGAIRPRSFHSLVFFGFGDSSTRSVTA